MNRRKGGAGRGERFGGGGGQQQLLAPKNDLTLLRELEQLRTPPAALVDMADATNNNDAPQEPLKATRRFAP